MHIDTLIQPIRSLYLLQVGSKYRSNHRSYRDIMPLSQNHRKMYLQTIVTLGTMLEDMLYDSTGDLRAVSSDMIHCTLGIQHIKVRWE